MDTLSLREWMEMRLEDVESFLRRHQRALYVLAALAALGAGAWLYPAVAVQVATTRPHLDPVDRSAVARGRGAEPVRAGSWDAAGSFASGRGSPARRPRHRSGERPASDSPAPVPLAAASGNPGYVWIQVAGAVARPGVYRVPAGTRGFQVVRAAGGLLPDADLGRVNLARRLADEALLVVPVKGAPQPDPTAAPRRMQRSKRFRRRPVGAADDPGAADEGSADDRTTDAAAPAEGLGVPPARLDLNQAAEGQLMVLPGVGPVLARAIVADRAARGPYRTAREVMRVPRVGLRLFQLIRPYVYVKGERIDEREAGAEPRSRMPNVALP